MKKLLKFLGFAVLALLAVAGAAILYLVNRKPAQRPAATVTVERTPERLARGEYLVKHVTICVECHSTRIVDRYAYPFAPGPALTGQVLLTRKQKFPGLMSAPNITPDHETGIGSWTDGEILRAMREGVDRDGKALFPMMPYENYRNLSDEDAHAVVAYIRSVPAVKHAVKRRELDFPLPLILPSLPKPLAGPVSGPDPNDRHAYGGYLATVAGCKFCHTPQNDHHEPIAEKAFQGGLELHTMEAWRLVSANLTPHPDTYIGKATKEEFIGRFKAFASLTPETSPPPQKGRNTVMPWIAFSGMKDEDLGAIYDYLKSLPPVKNPIDSFPDAADPKAPSEAPKQAAAAVSPSAPGSM